MLTAFQYSKPVHSVFSTMTTSHNTAAFNISASTMKQLGMFCCEQAYNGFMIYYLWQQD